ncbi:ornithine cyclodeaminase family protein [Aquamicrobium terrae]|uniref:Ornithine cyclodeaminase n=1 Tax=Aquamicrobium terrae TaxID=1324945 RepID=A0ABV2MXB4_9HYPH
MLYLSEQDARALVGHENAFGAVREVFASIARGEARNFPVVREDLGHAGAVYGIKSGFDRLGKILGLKSGGYWPGNEERGLTNHQSTITLFDADTGQPLAAVAANWLTAVRTAAASALSIDLLARQDTEVLGIVGAGFQSRFQLEAAVRRRKFREIVGWNFHADMLPNLERTAADLGLPFRAVTPQELCASADVIITITSAASAHLEAGWIRPGTHIACMGTDTRGKQELDPEILALGSVFTDEVEQSISIGEAQHAFAAGRLRRDAICQIGRVIVGERLGRASDDEVTVFDGTGVALQDLAVAKIALEAAAAQELGKSLTA